MNRKENVPGIILISAILTILLISLFNFFYRHNNWRKRILFFPQFSSKELAGEERLLPAGKSLERDIQLLVEEIILGPIVPTHERILPKNVRLESLIVRDGIVYLDLSKELIFANMDMNHGLDEMIRAVGNSVLFNFPNTNKLFIFVNGQVPGEEYKEGVKFYPQSLR